jgi:hypothetical protein
MPTPLELLTGAVLQTRLSPQGLPPILQGGGFGGPAPHSQPRPAAPQKGSSSQQVPNVLDRPAPPPIVQTPDPQAPVAPQAQPQQPQATGAPQVNPQVVAQASAIMAALTGGNPYQTIGSALGVPFNVPFMPGSQSPAFTPTLIPGTHQGLSSLFGALNPALSGNPAIASLFQPNSFQFQQVPIGGNESQFMPVPASSLIGPALQALTQLIAGGGA